MAPVHGLTGRVRMVRIGKMRNGFKRRKGSQEFPAAVPWFIPDVKEGVDLEAIYEALKPYNPHVKEWNIEAWQKPWSSSSGIIGPNVLPITIPIEDAPPWNELFPQWLKCYRSGGLICKGDGQNVLYRVNGDTGVVLDAEALEALECDPRTCAKFSPPRPKDGEKEKKPQCGVVGTFHFFLRGYPGFEVFVYETGSRNSITNINTQLLMFRGHFKQVMGLQALLSVSMETFEVRGSKKTAPVCRLSIDPKMAVVAPHLVSTPQAAEYDHPQPVEFYPDAAPVEESDVDDEVEVEPPKCCRPSCARALSSAEVDECLAYGEEIGSFTLGSSEFYCAGHLAEVKKAREIEKG